MKKVLLSLLTLILLIMPCKVMADEAYDYTITVYTGNEGAFEDGTTSRKITVKAGSAVTIEIKNDALVINSGTPEKIVLKKTTAADGSEEDNIHYIKGFKETGRDNSSYAVSRTLGKVTADMDFVITYGVPGDMVKYTVLYIDEAGNTLHEPDEYYGKVGDAPIVSHQYIEGYLPHAYNVTKTLVEDESQNVMTFTYAVVTTVTPVTPGGAGGAGAGTIDVTPATPEGGGGENPQPAPGGDEQPTPGGDENPQPTPGGDDQPSPTPGGDDQQNPPQPIDIDDQDTPLAPGNRNSWLIYAAGGVAGVGIIAFLLTRKKNEEEEEENKQ
jgi:hypothetical protein